MLIYIMPAAYTKIMLQDTSRKNRPPHQGTPLFLLTFI